MSTKIYTGFRIETTDLAEIRAMVDKVRPDIVLRAQGLLDDFMKHIQTKEKGKQFSVWLDMRRATVDKGLRNPLVDTQFDLLFIPLPGYCIGICYTEHSEWFDFWLAIPGVRDWSYWNNTDPDENVSAEEWASRKKDWDSLGFHVPAMEGFTISVMDPMGPFPKDFPKEG